MGDPDWGLRAGPRLLHQREHVRDVRRQERHRPAAGSCAAAVPDLDERWQFDYWAEQKHGGRLLLLGLVLVLLVLVILVVLMVLVLVPVVELVVLPLPLPLPQLLLC